MQIQQLSVFIENKPGRMAEVTEVLAEANIAIRAISMIWFWISCKRPIS